MKLFRLRFILLGLLLCICHVWCSTCGREFGDAASNAYYAQIVVIGTVSQQLPPDVKNTYDSIVRVKTSRDILKGSKILKTNFKFRRGFSITVGKFGEEDVINCVSPVKRDQKYLFFLNVTNSVKYYTQTGLPIHAKSKRDFKKSKKLVTRMLCNKGDCVKSPVWDNKRKMKDKTIEIGKSIELNCKLKRSSFPSALYKWYKNDTEVQSLNISGLTIKDSKKGSRLKIKKASPADAGTYKCIAANIGGSIQQEAVINISGVAGPSNPSREMRDKSQKYNGTLKLTCRTKSGVKPKPIFLWYKDGKEIQTGSRKGLTIKTRGSESKLRKKNVVHSDEGTYKCVAKNAGGMATQTSKVKVVGAPKLPGPNRTIPCGKEGDGYCFNGGTCRIMLEFRKNTTYCVCPKNYRGKRCDSFTYPGRKIREEQKLAQDRHLIIVGIISGILLFIGICVLSYFLAKRRREQFYRRRRQNMNGNIEDNIPQVYRPLIGCDEIDGLKKHMNGVVIHKVGSDETQTIETCFLGNDKGSLYINPLEGYIQGNDKNSRNRKPAISIEEDPSPEPATPEDSCEFPNENSSVTPKNKNSGSNSASDGAPNERLNDLSPRRQSQGREHSKPGAINGVPNIQGSDPTKPPAFNLDTDSEDDILSDGTPLTPLHISEEEDNNERNKTNNKQGSTSTMDRVEEKNRKNSNTKECNESKPIEPSELFPMIKKKDKPPPPPPQQQPQNEKLYASSSSSSSDGGESDSSSTTEGCDSPNTLANLHEELGSDPVLHQVMIQNNYNPEANPPGPVHGPENKGPAPEARQPKPQGTRGPSTRPTGQRGPGGPRDHGPRGHHHHHHRDPRGPPRDHREHGPRVPGPRDPRDHREMRDPRDMRDPNHPRDPRDPRGPPRDPRDPRDPRHQGFRPAPLRDPRDHRPDQGPRSGPRDPGARGPPGPRDPSNRPMPPRDIGPTRDPNHKNAAPQPPAPDSRGPEPQPQQNIPPFPVFSNFYDTPPVDNRNQRLKTVGRNQGPISL